MPGFVVPVRPVEPFRIAAPIGADAGFDPRHPFRDLVLRVGSEVRLDSDHPGRRTPASAAAVSSLSRVFCRPCASKFSGTSHCS